MFSSSRFLLARAVGIAVLLLVLAASAQAQTPPSVPSPTVQQVLAGVRATIATTIATLPDIECQEQAHSVVLHNGKVKRDVTLNSTLQARRMNDKTGDFSEERIPAPRGSVDGGTLCIAPSRLCQSQAMPSISSYSARPACHR